MSGTFSLACVATLLLLAAATLFAAARTHEARCRLYRRLIDALYSSDDGLFPALVSEGIPLRTEEECGGQSLKLLSHAALMGHVAAVRALLEAGADVGPSAWNAGETASPLAIAVYRPRFAGFGVWHPSSRGWSPRPVAPCVRALLEAGADAKEMDASGRTALHKLLITWEHKEEDVAETVHLLLRYGADPAAADAAGCTPAHLAMLRQMHVSECAAVAAAVLCRVPVWTPLDTVHLLRRMSWITDAIPVLSLLSVHGSFSTPPTLSDDDDVLSADSLLAGLCWPKLNVELDDDDPQWQSDNRETENVHFRHEIFRLLVQYTLPLAAPREKPDLDPLRILGILQYLARVSEDLAAINRPGRWAGHAAEQWRRASLVGALGYTTNSAALSIAPTQLLLHWSWRRRSPAIIRRASLRASAAKPGLGAPKKPALRS